MNQDKTTLKLTIFAFGTMALAIILSYIIVPNITTVTIDNSIPIGIATAIMSALVVGYIVFLKH